MGTGFHAVTTANAQGGIGCFGDIDPHMADVVATVAVGATVWVVGDVIEGKGLK